MQLRSSAAWWIAKCSKATFPIHLRSRSIGRTHRIHSLTRRPCQQELLHKCSCPGCMSPDQPGRVLGFHMSPQHTDLQGQQPHAYCDSCGVV